jgi:hypothetical protein
MTRRRFQGLAGAAQASTADPAGHEVPAVAQQRSKTVLIRHGGDYPTTGRKSGEHHGRQSPQAIGGVQKATHAT